ECDSELGSGRLARRGLAGMTSEDIRVALPKPHTRDRIERDHARLFVPNGRPIDMMHRNRITRHGDDRTQVEVVVPVPRLALDDDQLPRGTERLEELAPVRERKIA